MARRSTLVAVAAALFAAWPASAFAVTAPPNPPQVTSMYALPATIHWTPAPDVLNASQTVLQASGSCGAPTTAAVAVENVSNSESSYTVGSLSDGAYCFAIRATDILGATADSPGVTLTIDTVSPTAGILVAGHAGGSVSGVVSLAATSADAVSGVAASVLHVGAVGACPSGAVLGSAWDTTAYANGAYDVCNVVSDNAGHGAVATVTVTVANAVRAPAALTPGVGPLDKVAPRPPTRVVVIAPRAKRGTRVVPLTLHWSKPTTPDLDRVVVVLNMKRAPRGPIDGRVINRGLETTAAFKFGAHANAHIALYAYDHSGNVSRAARPKVSLASLIPLRPLGGSVVRKAPQLRWRPSKHVAYYNVQLFRNGHRVLVRWPSHPFFRFQAGKLRPGTYVWFVWPAMKHQGAAPTFGKLIGRSMFVVKGSKRVKAR
jgi:hypothetical protein